MIALIIVTGISISLSLTYQNNNESKAISINQLAGKNKSINPLDKWSESYELTIEYIKKHEGFAGGKPYICPGGYKTIGYGHVIKKNESFTQLSKIQADSLLRDDFNKALKLVEKTTKIGGTRKLAIAHFVFTRGIGTFLRSELKNLVDNNKKIDKEILKWCYYRSGTGKLVKSMHALNIRKWELDMYKGEL